MNLDLDIIRALLDASATRDLSPLAKFDERSLNAHREQLLNGGFVTGGSSQNIPAQGKPPVKQYTHLNLEPSGKRTHELSKRATLWQRAKEACESDDCSWTIFDLLTFLESHSGDAAG